MHKYVRVRSIGRTAMGECSLVYNLEDQRLYVVKATHLDSLSQAQRSAAFNEAAVLSTLKHPNILKFVESFSRKRCDKPSTLCIVMEYAEGGDMRTRHQAVDGADLPEEEIVDRFIQTCLAVDHCHRAKVVHGDLRPQNIFLTSLGRIKLGNFGTSHVLQDADGGAAAAGRACAPPGDPDPLNEELRTKADMWSLGVLLYWLCTRRHPFGGDSPSSPSAQTGPRDYEGLPDRFSPPLRGLVDALLSPNCTARPGASEVLQSPLVQGRVRQWHEEARADGAKQEYLQLLRASATVPVDRPIALTCGDRPFKGLPRPSSALRALALVDALPQCRRAPSDAGSEPDPSPGSVASSKCSASPRVRRGRALSAKVGGRDAGAPAGPARSPRHPTAKAHPAHATPHFGYKLQRPGSLQAPVVPQGPIARRRGSWPNHGLASPGSDAPAARPRRSTVPDITQPALAAAARPCGPLRPIVQRCLPTAPPRSTGSSRSLTPPQPHGTRPPSSPLRPRVGPGFQRIPAGWHGDAPAIPALQSLPISLSLPSPPNTRRKSKPRPLP